MDIVLSHAEEEIILLVRKAKPYERIEIMCDVTGKPDTYIYYQSSKRMVLGDQKRFMQMPNRRFTED